MKRYKLLLIALISFGWSVEYQTEDIIVPYISIGYQIGVSSYGWFSGPQISFGLINSHGYEVVHYINSIPQLKHRNQSLTLLSLCFGKKKYRDIDRIEKFIDIQIMYNEGKLEEGKIPIGIGVGKLYYNNKSSFKLKGYTSFLTCWTIDYNLSDKKYSFSSVSVAPIFDMDKIQLGSRYIYPFEPKIKIKL